jgi:hypothetical protein
MENYKCSTAGRVAVACRAFDLLLLLLMAGGC